MSELSDLKKILERNINAYSKYTEPNRNFNEIKDQLEDLRNYIISAARVVSNTDVPMSLVVTLSGFLSNWLSLFARIENYDAFGDAKRDGVERRTIISSVNQWYTACMSAKGNNFLATYAAIKSFENKDVEGSKQILDEINLIREQSDAQAKEIEKKRLLIEEDLKQFEKRYSDTYKRLEITAQEDIHSKYAEDSKKRATFWLRWLIGACAALLITLYLFFQHFCFEYPCIDKVTCGCNKPILYLEIFKAVTYRIFIVSFIVYIISFCIRNYNACMHNFTINIHRANSLAAARELVGRAKTEEGNDNIIAQAVNAIFSHQPTGYNNKDPENIVTTLTEKIIEKTPLGKG